MTYPQHPSQPGQQSPGQFGIYPPPPKKKMSAGAKVGIGCGGAFGALVLLGIVGAAVSGGDPATSGEKADRAAAAPATERPEDTAEPAEAKPQSKPVEKPAAAPKSPADQFKAFVTKHGSPQEKAAIGHVTKVQGAEEMNDILDSVDIYTDFTGGLMGPHQSEGKLIASAFADWKDSKNGLVTVYDVKGDLLSNGNF
ncbi:hypothetical protein [Streptomyces tubercidicus]|uniref:hypothetical protein n=1 Tax=Streptomyces tubercidicus TaxID=47759 RepID=UPI0036B0FFE4